MTSAHLINLVGKTDLLILAAVYEKSLMYVGNDSGLVHIAMAVGIPTVCIIGGGHLGRFYPYGDEKMHIPVYYKMPCFGCNWKCIYPEIRCINNINVDNVIKNIDRIFEKLRTSTMR